MLLWRPVGIHELALIFEADMAAFPPRLPGQPIFYPVLNSGYAEQIAREWNAPAEGGAGYVTRFAVGDAFAERFERHTVGARQHEELWVPAAELTEFNAQLLGSIEVTCAFFGLRFAGHVPPGFLLAGQDARAQLTTLVAVLDYNGVDFLLETQANELAVFANFPYWRAASPEVLGCTAAAQAKVLDAIRRSWPEAKRKAPLVERSEIAV
jgi:hypothetical protein